MRRACRARQRRRRKWHADGTARGCGRGRAARAVGIGSRGACTVHSTVRCEAKARASTGSTHRFAAASPVTQNAAKMPHMAEPCTKGGAQEAASGGVLRSQLLRDLLTKRRRRCGRREERGAEDHVFLDSVARTRHAHARATTTRSIVDWLAIELSRLTSVALLRALHCPAARAPDMSTSPKRGQTETSRDTALLREVLRKQESAAEGAWENAEFMLKAGARRACLA